MGGSSKPHFPDPPQYPSPPAAPDMSRSFELAVQNQEQQNAISARQAAIAEGQLAIAEDRYGLSKQYRPVQEKALKDAVRGEDPARDEAQARNSVMQRVTPAHEGLSKAAQRAAGMKADSPNVMAGHEQLGAGLAGAQGNAQAEASGRTRLGNVQKKLDAVGDARGIPSTAVRGMSAASTVMGSAARTSGAATQNFMQVLASGEQASYSAAVSQWQYETGVLQAQYQYDMQLAAAEAGGGSGWLSGALAGGMIGSYFGFVGMGVGAGVGGVAGALFS